MLEPGFKLSVQGCAYMRSLETSAGETKTQAAVATEKVKMHQYENRTNKLALYLFVQFAVIFVDFAYLA